MDMAKVHDSYAFLLQVVLCDFIMFLGTPAYSYLSSADLCQIYRNVGSGAARGHQHGTYAQSFLRHIPHES